MTDRELLELAAKAAGIEVRFMRTMSADFRCDLGELPYTCKPGQHHDERKRFSDWCVPWNSLADDGDALRLAVKVRIDMPWQPIYPTTTENEELALIRRAITTAAAEIGKAMP